MIAVAAGAALLVLAVFGLRAFSTASISGVKTALAAALAGAGLVLVLVLLVSGRGGQVAWALALFGPAVWRWWKARQPPAPLGSATPADTVETAMLSMRLDPSSGTLSGRVRRGIHAGRDLADLALEDLHALLGEAASEDPESVPLLEAWLDRAHPGWREITEVPLSARAEALAVLGLAEGATEAEIRTAHARLMRAAHPDAGGSDWLAARLNAARDTLIG
ncbi:hypothetical protein [Roseomonas sp. WA12]